ncbi:tyrosine-type recombinase/integrase [Lentzea sp. NEAU-D7]|uniref:tyrosine-type recombinase/integrase n=1 Tax=Lentzea sp. NEAU-D7 TaxID=2994667 RepID=UPI00224A95F6|nr:site-specific integrase [Lentzea sp. NEAU-D7]MCX2948130.1 site-specific integrase [Lentzea sp. NEAU-D7]
MGRPPLDLGTYGAIRCYETDSGWRATTKYRDYDGKTRPVERWGKTKSAAERSLKKALAERKGPSGSSLTRESRFKEALDQWFTKFQALADAGKRSPSSVDTYRSIMDRHVLPGLGELRIREMTVARVDAFLGALWRSVSVDTAKTARSVISGALRIAVRDKALDTNPVREAEPLEAGRKKSPRALTREERVRWLEMLESDPKAVKRDLPDLSRFMMATGVRIGEALAVYWEDIDFKAGTVAVNYTVIRVKDIGLIRKSTKTEAGERTLLLPRWALDMLQRRRKTTSFPNGPIFPDALGGLRDPSNTRKDLRKARGGDEFAWVTSHVFRKTAATILDEAGLSARQVADQLGHARPSMTQDTYMGRKLVDRRAADALEDALGGPKDDQAEDDEVE